MSKQSLKNQAYQLIKQKILECEYLPGTLLNENDLCRLLSISRTPLRDALIRLEHDGLIQSIPSKGYEIKGIELQDLNTYFEARLFLEPHEVEHHGPQVDKNELNIYSNFFKDDSIISRPDNFFRIASSLPDLFIDESSNPYVVQAYIQLKDQEIRIQRSFPLSKEHLVYLQKQYIGFLSSCLEDHWVQAVQEFQRIIESYKEFTFSVFLSSIAETSILERE